FPDQALKSTDIRIVRSKGARTKYALTVLAYPVTEMMVKIIYDRRRFDSNDITQILNHFATLLRKIIVEPDQSLLTLQETIASEQIPKVYSLRSQTIDNIVSPRTSTEEILMAIWTQLLKIENIGIHNNFFELGGHSLLATQLVSQIRNSFQIELPLSDLFDTPTVNRLAEKIDRAIRAQHVGRIPPIHKIERVGQLPLSFAQQRLWFLDQLMPASFFYNVSSAVYLKGYLNVTALKQSINEVVRRHEVLRTSFVSVGGEPVQVISTSLNLPLVVVDLQMLSVPERESCARQLAIEEGRRPFSLSNCPLLRISLLKLTEQEYLLLLTMHQIVADLWSFGIFIKEMMVLYEAFIKDQPATLPDLPIQYVDFAYWQRQWLQGEVLETHLCYWRQQLGNNLPILNLPIDHPRPLLPAFLGSRKSFILSKELSQELKRLGHQEGATLFMVLLTAFKVLLCWYTGQKDIVVGSPIANRSQSESEGLIGFFTNLLVLRSDLSGNPTFQQLLKQVRKVALGAYAHQDLPFERLVEELQPKRDLSHAPLFQVAFVLQNTPIPTPVLPDLKISSFDFDIGSARLDLTLFMADREQGLTGTINYRTDLFEEATISRIVDHFQAILSAVVTHPQEHIARLTFLSQVADLYLTVNATSKPLPSGLLHTLFTTRVLTQADQPAVITTDKTLTYQELDRYSNQLGWQLRQSGALPNRLVAVVMEKGWEQIVAVLGIVKAGAAYLPIDANLPKERILYLLEQGEVKLALTQSWVDQRLCWPTNIERITIDPLQLSYIADQAIEPIQDQTDLAYVIFTSGSTGQPKGVMIDHRGAVNTIIDINQRYTVTPEDRVLALSALNFDLSVYDIWGMLAAGGAIVIPGADKQREPSCWIELIIRERVTIWNSVPAMMEMLVEYTRGRTTRLDCLRLALLSGDWIPVNLPDRVKNLSPDIQVVSLGGATEASIWSIIYPIEKVDPN
ncbi:MAG: condensation domain-containing protein, partial [Acidobacteriota bacterium]